MIDEGLSPDDLKDIFHREREFVLRDRVVFAGEAARLAARIRSRAESTMSDERVMTLSESLAPGLGTFADVHHSCLG